ncbi:unnamed protein product, partial [Didymodactylos carnosus]
EYHPMDSLMENERSPSATLKLCELNIRFSKETSPKKKTALIQYIFLRSPYLKKLALNINNLEYFFGNDQNNFVIFKNIKHLELTKPRATEYNTNNLENIITVFPNLNYLVLGTCHFVYDQVIPLITQLAKNLKCLSILYIDKYLLRSDDEIDMIKSIPVLENKQCVVSYPRRTALVIWL